jgi:threonine dehydratase
VTNFLSNTTTGQVIDRDAIESTSVLIAPHVRRTPVIEVDGRELGLGPYAVVLKLEHLQHAGSFKARGAFANLLLRDVPDVGVAAASGGNHGAAVALAAQRLGHPARVFVPGYSTAAKVDRIRRYGAELIVGGDDIGDSFAACRAWSHETGALEVHPYDQHETMLGTGTLAAELEGQAGALDRVLVAVGGGGLLGGVASWFAGRVDVVGVEPVDAPTLHHALAAGGPVDAPIGSLAADSLAPRRLGDLVYPIVARWANSPVLVDDAAITDAQHRLWDRLRILVEPGGATALASLVAGSVAPRPGERVGVVLSGANTSVIPVVDGHRVPDR